ncbi:DUF2851 family protein [Gillisia limnaea]|uniref:DUF2851 domain-containing protein n=1 Tax=Gillisia limnaea (strain DSM 15749 / LMG 21470 / R-8282) TaxID=865937 RepID=H2BUL7_GILLR|nr:DUF2851 family protein [Gillisia limnaea]EHQ01672.1 hypothetical protein Gilli_0987 [Gillisia limnaea DSM 15749]
MQEDFLHYIWRFKKFDFGNARTVSGLPVTIISTGTANLNSGPDFFNAKMNIGEQLWAGNVEIHINSTDWYLHNHETDPNYDNVILHVVWKDDVEIFRKDNSPIPTLELQHLIPEITLQNYRNLLIAPNDKWINCEKDFGKFEDFEMNNWLERMYFERLQDKSEVILELLKNSGNNWEEVLFKLLAKNFGLNVNGGAFLNMAQSIDFKIIQKNQNSQLALEALFLGQSGLLDGHIEDVQFSKFQKEYKFLKNKFRLENDYVERAKFFRLRPNNFPNIRLSQLAGLYHKVPHLFSKIIKAKDKSQLHEIFDVETSDYWKTHYSFDKPHPSKRKPLTKNFKDLLIINTLIPLRFCYSKKTGVGASEDILELMEEIISEKNGITAKFNKLRENTSINALQSQALLHLKSNYCDKNLCLNCNFGIKLIQGFR